MRNAERRVDRAIRITPREDRDRYANEWRSDLEAGPHHGVDRSDVAKGALAMAVRLRLRQVSNAFTGGKGAFVAIGCWAALVFLGILGLLFGQLPLLLFLAALVVLAIAFAHAGTPSHWSHWLMAASIALGTCSAAFVWWAMGANIEADDAMTSAPRAAAWDGAGILLMLASIVGFLAATIVAVSRERKHRP